MSEVGSPWSASVLMPVGGACDGTKETLIGWQILAVGVLAPPVDGLPCRRGFGGGKGHLSPAEKKKEIDHQICVGGMQTFFFFCQSKFLT